MVVQLLRANYDSRVYGHQKEYVQIIRITIHLFVKLSSLEDKNPKSQDLAHAQNRIGFCYEFATKLLQI